MIWFLILLLGALVAAALWALGKVRDAPFQLLLAGLLVACAGYAWQGRPALPGSPGKPPQASEVGGEAFIEARYRLLGRFDRAGPWLNMADSFIRQGKTELAVGILRSGIRAHPEDSDLWIGLGNALVLHAQGMVTQPAQYAFERADQLAPGSPGPKYFYGLALAAGGRFAEAETMWRQVMAAAPPSASWRPYVEERLRRLILIRAIAEGRLSMPPDMPAQ